MKKVLVLVMLGFLFFGCEDKQEQSQDEPKVGESHFVDYEKIEPFKLGEEIVLKSVNGGEKTLVRTEKGFVLKGDEKKIIMFDIFGTFCPPCKEEAPRLMQFQLDNKDDMLLIGLIMFEKVTDKYIVENFASAYNAYYFISNSTQNAKILSTIVKDIDYQKIIQLPFKVVLKNGNYQTLSDVWGSSDGVKYYIGAVRVEIMQADLNEFKN